MAGMSTSLAIAAESKTAERSQMQQHDVTALLHLLLALNVFQLWQFLFHSNYTGSPTRHS